MKSPNYRNRVIVTAAAMVRFAILTALLSYSWSQPVSLVFANRDSSLARQYPTGCGSHPRCELLSAQSKSDGPAQQRATDSCDKLPLCFIENRGQVDSSIRYYVKGADKSVYFTSTGITFVLTGRKDRDVAEGPVDNHLFRSGSFPTQKCTEDARLQYALNLDFICARPGVKPVGQDQTSATINYFKGTRDQWKTHLRTYSTVSYSDVWPGVDLIYTGTVNQMKYTFVVKPGADPNQIRLAYRGASEVRINSDQQIEVMTPVGGFHDEKPYSYQEVDGNRVLINTAYALVDNETRSPQRYGFRLGVYDKSKPLMIDPAVRVYTGFIGGSGNDRGNGIAVDDRGNAYVVGTTTSSSFPNRDASGTIGGRGRSISCGVTCSGDAFVVKVRADGTGLDYASFIGGRGDEEGNGVAVQPTGEVYIVGSSEADAANPFNTTFPVMKGPNPLFGGIRDAFVAKLDIDGALVYSGFIGGSGDEEGRGIAVDSGGNAYITGKTASDESSFPQAGGFGSLPGLDQRFRKGAGVFDLFYFAFAVKVSFDGTLAKFEYATYIGGQFDDEGRGVAVDSRGNAYIVGTTESPGFDPFSFPSPAPGLAPRSTGPKVGGTNSDAFVVELNNTGDTAIYVAFIGGDAFDSGNGIALNSVGNAYVTGGTASSPPLFPATNGPTTRRHGGEDAFVARLSANGASLDYAGYIGGAGEEEGEGIAVDGEGNAYVTGFTESNGEFPGDGFPGGLGIDSISGPDRVLTGARDAFLVRVTFDSTTHATMFDLATYIGHLGEEEGTGIAVDKAGNAYVTGCTNSERLDSDRFLVPASPHRKFNGGDSDAFVEKIGATTGGSIFGPRLDIFGPFTRSVAPIGSVIAFPITVSNLGSETAFGVTVSHSFPVSLTFVSCSVAGGACEPAGDGSFVTKIPSLLPDGSETITLFAVVNCSAPEGASLSVTSTLSASTPFAFAINRTATSTVVVLPRLCLTDDVSGNTLLFTPVTGDYQLTVSGPGGFTIIGKGTVSINGCVLQLIDTESDTNAFSLNLLAQLNMCSNSGTVSIKLTPGASFTISDSNTANNSCACP